MTAVRELRSTDRIQAEVQRVVDELLAERGNEAEVTVPLPTRCAPDPKGCNWTMLTFKGDCAYFSLVSAAMIRVQSKWNLGPR